MVDSQLITRGKQSFVISMLELCVSPTSRCPRVDISWLLFQFNYRLPAVLHLSGLDKQNLGGNNRLNPLLRTALRGRSDLQRRSLYSLHPCAQTLELNNRAPGCRRDQELEFSGGQIKLKVLSLTSNVQPLQSAHLGAVKPAAGSLCCYPGASLSFLEGNYQKQLCW